MKTQLLHTPEGVRDIYNGECEEKLLIQDRVHSVMKLYGYSDIQTPSFEFFDIFNKERGSVASKNMFKFFDREGNTLVLRPDITPAIARCAAKYFENETGPVRLCYISNSFINNSRYQGRLKETTQAGCELIGDNSLYADTEMIALLIQSILKSGLTNFLVEVGHVGFFKGLVEEAGLSDAAAKELCEIIRDKKVFRVGEVLTAEGIDDCKAEVFYKLPTLFGGLDVLEKAKELTSNPKALESVRHLLKMYELLCAYGVEKYVSFDLGMLSELDYYTGVIFKSYTYDVGEPIANGGRYDSLIGQFGTAKASIGFCITIDLLHQAIKRQKIELPKAKRPVLVVYDEADAVLALKLVNRLRNDDIPAVMGPKTSDCRLDEYEQVIEADITNCERYGVR